jgi:phage/plasmid-associated DNA primase
MIGCNNRPRFADKSDGVYRRMIPVPFRVQIEQKRRIPNMDKPWWWAQSGELPGMLLWAIAGLDRLRRKGCFILPRICRNALDDYRVENNPAMQFLRENTSVEKGTETPCSEIYDRYRRWCTDNGFHALSSRSFGKEISRIAPAGNPIRRQQRRVMGSQVWFYVGLSSESHDNTNSKTQEKDLF